MQKDGIPPVPAVTAGTAEVAKKIAQKAGTTERTFYRVHAIQKKGGPEINALVANGELGGDTADTFVQNVPKEKQTEIIERGGRKAVLEEVNRIEKAKADNKQESDDIQKFKELTESFNEKMLVAKAEIEARFNSIRADVPKTDRELLLDVAKDVGYIKEKLDGP